MSGSIEETVRRKMDEFVQQAEARGVDPGDPNLHLTLIAGIMEAYTTTVEALGLAAPENAEDMINAIYAVLGDYERRQLERDMDQ